MSSQINDLCRTWIREWTKIDKDKWRKDLAAFENLIAWRRYTKYLKSLKAYLGPGVQLRLPYDFSKYPVMPVEMLTTGRRGPTGCPSCGGSYG